MSPTRSLDQALARETARAACVCVCRRRRDYPKNGSVPQLLYATRRRHPQRAAPARPGPNFCVFLSFFPSFARDGNKKERETGKDEEKETTQVLQREWREAGHAGEPYTVDNDAGFDYVDAELTGVGRAQALALAPRFASLPAPPTLLVVSPMRRATLTGLIALQDALPPPRVIACELCHETGGKYTCDKRLSKAELFLLYPTVDYSEIGDLDPSASRSARPSKKRETCISSSSSSSSSSSRVACIRHFYSTTRPLSLSTVVDGGQQLSRRESLAEGKKQSCCSLRYWGDGLVRETKAAIAQRGADFLAWLHDRPETVVAVAAHSGFLLALVNAALTTQDEQSRTWFGTGECRALALTWEPSDIE